MVELAVSGDKRMTVREVAAALGVSPDTVLNSIKDIEAQSENIRFGKVQGSHGGKPYYVLDEAHVTAVKMNLRKNSEVAAQPKTSLEKAMTTREIAEALDLSYGTVYNSARELFPDRIENGKQALWDEREATAIKSNLLKNSKVAAQPKTSLEKALVIQQALVYQQEIIADLQRRTADQAKQIAEMKPKAETLDKITATDSDISVRELASILAVPHLGQNNLFQKLRDDGYIDGFNRPYRQYIESGLMYEKEYYVPQLDATKQQLRITQKGVAHFAHKYSPTRTA